MSTQVLAEIIGPYYLVLGLSMLFYAKVWIKLIGDFEKNHLSYVIGGAMALILGLILVNYHNVWTGGFDAIVVTLTGWIALLKGVFYFLAPGSWTRASLRTFKCDTCIYLSGAVIAIVGAILTYNLYLA